MPAISCLCGSDKLGTSWMLGALIMYAAGSMVGWWFYLYQALTGSHNEGLYVTFFVYYYAYYSVSIVFCMLWFRFVSRLRKRAAGSKIHPRELWCIYRMAESPTQAGRESCGGNRFVLQLASRHCSFFHIIVMQVIAGFAIAEIGMAIFFQAYASQWDGFHIATGISCYPVLLVLPFICVCAHRVIFAPEVRKWVQEDPRSDLDFGPGINYGADD